MLGVAGMSLPSSPDLWPASLRKKPLPAEDDRDLESVVLDGMFWAPPLYMLLAPPHFQICVQATQTMLLRKVECVDEEKMSEK